MTTCVLGASRATPGRAAKLQPLTLPHLPHRLTARHTFGRLHSFFVSICSRASFAYVIATEEDDAMHAFFLSIVIGIALGLITAVLLLTSHRGQFPSRPNGLTIQLFLGFVASLIGALAVPAVFKPDFTAGVFVSLGTAQFHTMRGLERDAWKDVDDGEQVPRGAAYIEALAAAFEARIFFIFGVSAITTVLVHLLHWPIGVVVGVILAFVAQRLMRGKRLDDVADVVITAAEHKDGRWYVNGIPLIEDHKEASGPAPARSDQGETTSPGKPLPSTAMLGPVRNAVNEQSDGSQTAPQTAPQTGPQTAPQTAPQTGESVGSLQNEVRHHEYSLGSTPPVLAVVIKPDKFVSALALNHKGQQQAILHTVAANVGVNPQGPAPAAAFYDPVSNHLLLLLSPLWPDEQAAAQAARGAPVLEAVMPRGFPREVRLHRSTV